MRTIWYFVSALVFESPWIPISGPKRLLLRLFGAKIGAGVVFKPHVRIKYPWHLEIGDYCWIGEEAWIDNLTLVRLEPHCVISQGAYLCTGSHDFRSDTFDLIVKPIVMERGAWVCAKAVVLGGVSIGANAVVSAGAVANRDVPAGEIWHASRQV